jgi:hypothetical protein
MAGASYRTVEEITMRSRLQSMGSTMSLFVLCGCASAETSSAEAEQDVIEPPGRADASVRSAGETYRADDAMTICHDNGDCGALQLCSTPLGQCGGQGVCEGRGISLYCVGRYLPVCGCDGRTYKNECFARKAGAAIDREGTCLSSCDAGSDCPTE